MLVREPVFAGRFYAAGEAACRREVEACTTDVPPLPAGVMYGGIVPHAGWMFSGKVAGKVFAALAARRPATVVLFGADHRGRTDRAAVFPSGCWGTPLGPVLVDDRFVEHLLGQTNLVVEDAFAHEDEHSIEVQVPFIRHLLPEARIVPITVPPVGEAAEVGRAVARTMKSNRVEGVVVGSTDLTHYGPAYGFTPQGVGVSGITWAKEVNDRRLLDRVRRLEAEAVVPEAREHLNACGPGAVAATLGAAVQLGAERAEVLEHTTSFEVLEGRGSSDSVGYAGVVLLGAEDA